MGQTCSKHPPRINPRIRTELDYEVDFTYISSNFHADKNMFSVKEKAMPSEEKEALINVLPCEVLEYIFSYLSLEDRVKTECVCKRWQLIGKQQLWVDARCLNFDKWEWAKKRQITDGILFAILSRCGPNVRDLQITNRGNQMTGRAIKIICQQCRNLVSIDLRLPNTDLHKNCLDGFGECCSKLETMHLQYDGSKKLLFRSLFKNCKILQTLDLSGENLCPRGNEVEVINKYLKCLSLNCYSRLRPHFLKQLRERCTAIEILQFGNFYNYKFITAELLMKTVLHYSQTLVTFDVQQCNERRLFFFLDEFPKLKSLLISWVYVPEHQHTEFRLADACRHINLFHAFDDKWNVEKSFVENVLAQIDRLSSLCFLSCTLSAGVCKLCRKYADTMRELVLEHISTSCKTSQWCEFFSSLSNLETLMLLHCDVGENDSLVSSLADSCWKLKMLKIICPVITDEGLSHISCLPCVKHVVLSGLEDISNKGILALASLGHLEVVDIARSFDWDGNRLSDTNFKITDESCSLFARNCPEFRILHAEGVINLTNSLVNAFGDSIRVGYLKQKITLHLEDTSVTWRHDTHERLKVHFGVAVFT